MRPPLDTEWHPDEKRLVLATELAPLAVSAVVAIAAAVMAGSVEALLLIVPLVPFAYLTLILGVLPCLWLLRRLRMETLWSFSAACGVGTIAPGLALYALLDDGAVEDGGGGAFARLMLLLLLPGGGLAALAGAVVYRLSRPRRDA